MPPGQAGAAAEKEPGKFIDKVAIFTDVQSIYYAMKQQISGLLTTEDLACTRLQEGDLSRPLRMHETKVTENRLIFSRF